MTCFFLESEEIPFVGQDICAMAYEEAERASLSDVNSIVSLDNVSLSDESPKCPKSLERWEDKHVRLLISLYSKFKKLLKGKTTKKEVFSKIAAEFNSTSDLKVTAEQCIRKWSKLESKQKEVEDNNKQTGRERKSWKYHDDMTECMGSSPKINPEFTFDTSSSASSGSSGQIRCDNGDDSHKSDESADESGDGKKRKKKVKFPTRKRKSNSSAAEMLEFLHSYSEKREKAEAEKIALLKSMKEEKKEFFSQFLDFLKKKNKNWDTVIFS